MQLDDYAGPSRPELHKRSDVVHQILQLQPLWFQIPLISVTRPAPCGVDYISLFQLTFVLLLWELKIHCLMHQAGMCLTTTFGWRVCPSYKGHLYLHKRQLWSQSHQGMIDEIYRISISSGLHFLATGVTKVHRPSDFSSNIQWWKMNSKLLAHW